MIRSLQWLPFSRDKQTRSCRVARRASRFSVRHSAAARSLGVESLEDRTLLSITAAPLGESALVDTGWINGDGPSSLRNLGLDWATAASPAEASEPIERSGGTINIYVEPGLLDDILPAVAQYAADLMAEGYVVTWEEFSGDAAALRGELQYEWTTRSLDGALLVGDLPHLMFTTTDNFDRIPEETTYPHDLYFMDLDGQYTLNATGPDYHTAGTGDVGPEIYVSRITTGNFTLTGQTEAQLINEYFTKVHEYRTGVVWFQNRGMVFEDDDWFFWGTGQMDGLYDDVTTINTVTGTTKAAYLAILPQNYESILEATHAGSQAQEIIEGIAPDLYRVALWNTEVLAANPRQGFYNMFNCSAARFTDPDNLIATYVYGSDFGLNAVGSTKTGSMLSFPDYYTPQSTAATVGEAFESWFNLHAFPTNDPAHDGDVDWFYGMTMQGDPTLCPKTMGDPSDRYEENDTREFSYDLTARERTWLSTIDGYAIQSDEDWYRIDVTPGYERVVVDCTFTHSQGDIDIALYNDAGAELARSQGTANNEHLDHVVSATGSYYIRVYYANAGNRYDLWWDDVATIAEDNYEQNDTLAQAYPLTLREQVWLSAVDGMGRQLDDDWYRIEVTPGYERVKVDCSFYHHEGDVDIALFDATGAGLVASTGISDGEHIDYVVSGSGAYYVRVYYANAGTLYNLWWDDLPLVSEDNYEQNDSRGDAYDLSAHERTWLSTVNGPGIQADEDWYKIEVSSYAQRRVLVDCRFTHSEGDVDIALYDATGGWLAASSSADDNEYISYEVPGGGIYYVVVYYGNRGTSYDLWWDDASTIVEDAYEENDALAAAFDLTAREKTWLSSVGGLGIQRDEDWYEIELTPGYHRVQVDCYFSHPEGDIDLGLVDQFGNLLAGSWGVDDDEHIDHVVLDLFTNRTFYVVVAGANAGNPYDLWWDDLRAVTEDNYEENDSMLAPFDLTQNERTWLTTIDGWGVQQDVDWFRVEASPGFQRLRLDCRNTYAEGDVWMRLYDASGALLADSTTPDDDEFIECVVPQSGMYYVAVAGPDVGAVYNLWWDDAPLTVEDNYEENDDWSTAFNLSGSEQTWLSTIDGPGILADDDWYRIEASLGSDQIVVDCTFLHAEGDIEIALHNAAGSWLASSTSSDDDERIEYALSEAGTYYVRVYFYGPLGNQYDLRWDDVSLSPPLPGDANDDGVVNSVDAQILAAHWGMAAMDWEDGDFNDDDTINAMDASILAANWGATSTPPADKNPPVAPTREILVGPVQVNPAAARRSLRQPTVEVASITDDAAHDAALAAEYGPQAAPPVLDRSDLGCVAWSQTVARRTIRPLRHLELRVPGP